MSKLRVLFALVLPAIVFAMPVAAESDPAAKEAPAKDHGEASEEAAPHGSEDKAVTPKPEEVPVSTDPFCDAIADPAREQRYHLKQEELKALLASVNERVAELEKQKADYEEWVRRREDFAKLATKNLVEIYATMKPEASAVRLTELNPELAASLLLAITPRQASAILNEMDEKVAAALTGIMAASARKKDPS